jgi:hypothetical protein
VDSAIAGLIGAFVGSTSALVGQWLSNRYQRQVAEQVWNRNSKQKCYEDVKTLYVDTVAAFERAIRYTERLQDYSQLIEELPRINARLQLASGKSITDQAEAVSNLLFEWSTEFRQGAPKRIGDTGVVIVGTPDAPHQERARALYPSVCSEIIKLTDLMKNHLKSIEV